MLLSPLQLERHFFSRISLDTAEKPAGTGKAELGVQVAFSQDPEGTGRRIVRLRVSLAAGAEGTPPYTADLEVVGRFRVQPDFPAEKADALVRVNAPAVLYGAAREMLLNLTARGPHPAVSLPTVTFVAGAPAPDDREAAE